MMLKLDVADAMNRLAAERPIFHSEADFQFALAWLIKQTDPSLDIRLEVARTVTIDERPTRQHLDLLVSDPVSRRNLAVELKYLPPTAGISHRGEVFNLSDGGADDSARYDFIKDLVRLEGFVTDGTADAGIAIFLTGKPIYWQQRRTTRPTKDEQFRIHEGRELYGRMAWDLTAAESTRAARWRDLELRGSYPCRWTDYSHELGPMWRYLAIAVPQPH